MHFRSEAYADGVAQILGRQSASTGFLRAFARTAEPEALNCYAPTSKDFADFSQLTLAVNPAGKPHWIRYYDTAALSNVGCLYHPDPLLAPFAWQRAANGNRAYGICGVTHTVCSAGIMDGFGAIALAPLCEWDAVVCTSLAVKRAVTHILERWHEHLANLTGRGRDLKLQLPIIPLGADCDALDVDRDKREQLRMRLGVGANDVVALFVGRLSYHAKAHPLAMYAGLENVARQTNRRLHLIQYGWFANESIERDFRSSAAAMCPSVAMRFLSDRPEMRTSIWHAADIFISLADNIQETFGLTPIEAMAAGLPVIVSDWNGYRETVRHGIDGFLVETLMPKSGAGHDLVDRYAAGIDSYDRYIGNVSQCVAVDAAAFTNAFRQLVNEPGLRMSMGQAGKRRARETFDWPVVIQQYRHLWRELHERRAQSPAIQHERYSYPLRDDPFAVFAHYSTNTLDDDSVLTLGPQASPDRMRKILSMPLNTFALHVLCTLDEMQVLLAAIAENGAILAGDLVALIPHQSSAVVFRTLSWLAKIDAVRVSKLTEK